MNVKTKEILSNPDRCGHIIYTYTEEPQVIHAIALFSSAGLRKGEAVVLVMAEAHCEPVHDELRANGFDVEALIASGQLVCEVAENLLASFMFDGVIDELLFRAKIRGAIARTKAAGAERPMRMFGEMVNFIWQSRQRSTERLEELWNEVIREHSAPLLCAYGLAGSKLTAIPPSLMACHSHVLV
jgi:hypothetical protein